MAKQSEQKGENQPKGKFAGLEEEIVAFWEENKAFETSVTMRPADKTYTFYDGPPFATGLPHYGHIIGSLMKDMVPRFWTMQGYRVDRRWGWDCHGLPIENIIEKALDLPSRSDIEEYGVEKFNEACRNTVLTYANEWHGVIRRLGRWVDMDNDYKTMDIEYMESVWWVFKQLWDRDKIYEGKKSMHVCPRCSTPLSNFEVTLGYQDVEDNSVIWKFPIAGEDKTFLLAWTTTPWSTPGTMGLSIGQDFTYLKVLVAGEVVIFAKDRLEFVMGDVKEYEILEELKGADLVGLQYEPILDFYKQLPEVQEKSDNVYRVYAADYVEVTEGTGIVTVNGAYGEIDMEATKQNDLPLVLDVGMDGAYTAVAGPYAGVYVKDAEKTLLSDMQAAGRVWRTELYRHSYPHCWRCDTPLLNYATTSWFVKVEEMKEDLLKNNQKINWVPSNVKDGRFGIWLENARDWAISRSRFWGTPLPIWQSEDGDILCVGSRAELEELSGKAVTDLHKHIVDTIEIQKDGKTYRRIPDVLDCWFESGSMPYAQKHYPFENADNFTQGFPANYIAEGQDQTRGWFYTLHVLATALTTGDNPAIALPDGTTPAFQNCIVNGTVLAEDGKKMSKRLKNYPDPMTVIDKYGADALRYYLAISPAMESNNLNFTEQDVDEVQRKYINTFWNVFTFYQMFAEKETTEILPITDSGEVVHVLDQWILDRLGETANEVTEGYNKYLLRQASIPLQDFVQELSTWYVRRCRDRFKGEDAADRLMALRTLKTVLLTFVKLAAPVTPFITEKVFQELKLDSDPVSVHHCDWPTGAESFKNSEVAETMQSVRTIIEQALALRAEAGIKVRQPLQSVSITSELTDPFQQIIKEELNVRQVLSAEVVAIDTEISEELKLEGVLRELVRNTNMLRKKAGLTINDLISIKLQTSSELVAQALSVHGEEYQRSVLAESMAVVDDEQERSFKVEGQKVTLSF
ncbi:MAG: isoleucine--tRNA ligase [Candidatus Kerfeldbacteria bacterium CG15_BIG_FIL_POST_REV_8_21_14_020_45_12]|uniref:Isoleucine--tRNA ligase n=1 Tax=Candidatus Kerfeldbacteria bacterium CG15_BIG_FIL_POST_REV_8_21_14_020_45_12 TaxID=2014247 RepID=A0A2M7H4Q8_9BACT|nr:MAG: isoleucine--tRNA ligase [Candidatus Kerfeldbacteria bacterium CG15_BIG_FIL_POST_REV_8_21_14_020_45_12]PJA93375.1 MAG: isoleucine--tRNA ligase [Candidatus Kerfeldbacteria bacterium CG_4_9_14_3_um_filter_45_8]